MKQTIAEYCDEQLAKLEYGSVRSQIYIEIIELADTGYSLDEIIELLDVRYSHYEKLSENPDITETRKIFYKTKPKTYEEIKEELQNAFLEIQYKDLLAFLSEIYLSITNIKDVEDGCVIRFSHQPKKITSMKKCQIDKFWIVLKNIIEREYNENS